MKLSTRGRYAVMAMVDLALCPDYTPVALPDIALRQGLPLPYLEQLFVTLRQKGFVKSQRGPKGGYLLTRSTQDISIASIINAVGEPLRATRCRRLETEGKGCLPSGVECLTHHIWASLEKNIVQYLEGISLADICTHYEKGNEEDLPANYRIAEEVQP